MKGQASNNSLDLIGIMIPLVLIGGLGIPVMSEMAETVNATGATTHVLGYVPLVLALAMFVGAISFIRPTTPTRSSRSRSTEKTESEKEDSSSSSEESSEDSKPGIEILGYRVAW